MSGLTVAEAFAAIGKLGVDMAESVARPGQAAVSAVARWQNAEDDVAATYRK